MKTIVAQLRANNQIAIRYYSRPNCLKRKEQGDLTAQKEREQVALIQQRIENLTKLITHGCKESEISADTYFKNPVLSVSGDSLCKLLAGTQITKGEPICVPVCDISQQIEYFDEDSQRIVQTNYLELCERKLSLLDIIKKSQQGEKKERCWGKVQSVKKFTLNAKQKILEAGSVVDMHTEKGSQYELTLTIPGSGVEVYDAVARYSGYIVNRLTQIIRRLEANGCPVHWFFVWEHQKRGALHMHWCIAVSGHPMLSDYICRQLRAKWFSLLEELSVKTGIDLFKKRGFSGTWRHTPDAWQSNIAVVRKSVAAYFSKYLSKTCETSKFNGERRKQREALRKDNPDSLEFARVISLCPSRYWGCSSRVKRLCARYRVNVSFRISSEREGNFIAGIISEWVGELPGKLVKVSRTFKKVAPDTGFIYCKGWEQKIWFENSSIESVLLMFKRIYSNQERKKDGIGAILSLGEY